MNIEETLVEIKEKQSYWRGVVAGVIGSSAFFSGLVALVYYMVPIVQAIK